jgi:N-acetylglucosaminyldiphosphoundecaprenol N-acetyl-beta-D-mannosaminyltransferase
VSSAHPALRTCGVRIDVLDREGAADEVVARALAGGPCAVHLCNAYTLSLAVRSQRTADLLDAGDLNLPDGTPLVWVARRKGIETSGRVYGPDLMLDVLDRGRAHGLRHFLHGSTPEVLADLEATLRARLRGVEIVGSFSPPFRDATAAEDDEAVARIVASGAHVVWVGLGTPRQDEWVARLRDRIPVPLVAVGAAFDFHAGRKTQAPAWMQERGLEWLFRLATEPRRLWRRYLIGNPVFLLGLARGVEVVRPGEDRGAA